MVLSSNQSKVSLYGMRSLPIRRASRDISFAFAIPRGEFPRLVFLHSLGLGERGPCSRLLGNVN